MNQCADESEMRQAVLQVTTRLHLGEADRSIGLTARHLAERGWRSIIAAPDRTLDRDLAHAGVIQIPMRLDRCDPFSLVGNVLRLARLAREHGVGVIHAHDTASAWPAAFAARRSGASFMTSWHHLPPGRLSGLRRRLNGIMIAGDRVVATSEHIAERVADVFRIEPERLRVIRPGIDLREFDNARIRGPRVSAMAERWNIGVDGHVIYVPAPCVRAHGHLLLIDVIKEMARADILLVIGTHERIEPVYARELEAEVSRAGLVDRVRFVDERYDLAALLKLADTIVLPADEPLSSATVLIAAQSMGKPVIASHLGVLAECLMPAATGWLIAPTAKDELKTAIGLATALDSEARVRVAERARAFVDEQFDRERSAAKMRRLYQELMSSPLSTPQTIAAPMTLGQD